MQLHPSKTSSDSVAKKFGLEFAYPTSQNDFNPFYFLLLVDGGCILSISLCRSVHAYRMCTAHCAM